MRSVYAGAAGVLCVLFADAARADPPKPGSPGSYRIEPLNIQKEHRGSEGLALAGRNRMRTGDYQGALSAFDEALRTSMDPAIYRDRGLCHERLEHLYPAIDDFRRYLTALPDAADAEDIGERLDRLEAQARGVEKNRPSDSTEVRGVDTRLGMNVSAAASARLAREKPQEATAEDDPNKVSVRYGKGFLVAPFFEERAWFLQTSAAVTNPANLGDSFSLTECFGLHLGYAFGASGGPIVEGGYELFNAANVDLSTIHGISGLVAYEFRIGFDHAYDNQLIIAPGVGIEHLISQPANANFPSETYTAVVPRLRFGFRHMLTQAAGADFSIDGGLATFFDHPDDGQIPATPIVVARVALVWGM